MKFCSQCGTSAPDDVIFCSSCGTKFHLQQQTSVQTDKKMIILSKEQTDGQTQNEQIGQQLKTETNEQIGQQLKTGTNEQIGQQLQKQYVQTNQKNPQKQQFRNEPEKKSVGRKIALVSILSVLVLAGIVIGGFLFYRYTKTDEFAKYLEDYKEKADTYVSLGEYKDVYEDNLDEAERLISKKDFRKMPKQKSKMETLWSEIDEMVSQIEEQKVIFDDIVDEMESGEKYFFGDMEEEYYQTKEEAETAIAEYLVNEAQEKTKAFSELAEEIKKYDESQVEKYLDAVEKTTVSSNWLDLEKSLLDTRKQQVVDSVDEENYVKTKEAYDAFEKQKDSLEAVKNASHVLSGYNQADVSTDYEVRLYFDIAEITDWKNDGFTIYEKAQNENDWKYCELMKVDEVEGNMTIDLVADVSDSMSESFSAMQNILSSFATSTSADTYLGLSLIGDVYVRKLGFTQSKSDICNEINNLQCHGLTSLYQSLYSSVMYTATASGAKCVLAFTDGMNVPYKTGYDYSADDVIRVAKTYQIPVYIIGLGTNLDSSMLRKIAAETGGAYYDQITISDMGAIYNNIYSQQKNRYEVTYKSELESSKDRQIYMLYYDDNANVGIRFEQGLAASTLYNGYQMTFDEGNLAGYYTDQKYISSDDLSSISNINDLQKVINIYCAKNGYRFQNPNVLQEMISLGVITENGTLDMAGTTNNLKQNNIIWANYMSLYNRRYEMVYQEVYKVYNEHNRNISVEDLMPIVHQNLGQTDLTRFSVDVKAAYEAIK